MPKGPKGERRPADVIGNAVKVMRIAVGEDSDVELKSKLPETRKGVKGGEARAAKLLPSKRSKIASNAAKTRWAKSLVPEKIER
jgi:hypothetical protein